VTLEKAAPPVGLIVASAVQAVAVAVEDRVDLTLLATRNDSDSDSD